MLQFSHQMREPYYTLMQFQDIWMMEDVEGSAGGRCCRRHFEVEAAGECGWMEPLAARRWSSGGDFGSDKRHRTRTAPAFPALRRIAVTVTCPKVHPRPATVQTTFTTFSCDSFSTVNFPASHGNSKYTTPATLRSIAGHEDWPFSFPR